MLKRRSEVVVAILMSLLVSYCLLPRREYTYLALQSNKGEWVGQGREWRMGSDDSAFEYVQYVYGKPESGVRVQVRSKTKGGPDFRLCFAAPGEQLLQIGSYEGAVRHCIHEGKPGMDVSGCGRGNNRLSGRFEVLDIAYGPQGPTRLAINFEQDSECRASQTLTGSIRYHTSVP